LDFLENREETLAFFNEFKLRTIIDPADEVFLDLSQLKKMAPEAALVLIAEATRAAEYGCRLRGHRAPDGLIDRLLWDIGYYNYYGAGKVGPPPDGKRDRTFLVHQTGFDTNPRVAKHLIQEFLPVAELQAIEIKTLYDALVECMANVLQHAYPARQLKGFHLPNRWWLLGSMERSSHEISFCFFDQGVGIPNTIRTRWQHLVPIVSKSDNELVIQAVMEGLSSTKLDTRGKGLPTLKSFVDQYGTGELVIVTCRTMCNFRANATPNSIELTQALGGTLIIWTLQTGKVR
jgi:hypothetical protein